MLGRTIAYMALLLTGAQALPQSFILDMGNIDSAVPDPSAALANTTSRAFNWPTTLQTASVQTTTSAPGHTPVLNSTVTAAATFNSTRTGLPTTTIVVTLPDPTPRPTSTSERNDETSSLTDNEDATPLDTTAFEPLSKWPHWFTAATFTLVFYDVLTLGIFLWLWVFGYLWWFRRSNDRTRRAWGRRGRVGEVEMSRMDVPTRYGDGRHEREWVRTTRYGRVRSDSEQRARSAREAELEGEMRRLGMI
ncbi:hypothetical protein E8E12_010826 [Didymella heteroderae]|uniref:Uncharacterized protein n=1 Tax=Didymella heteroderae TaxID=1769908 RepID=A0A9P4WWY6_9PLEO|nr:hypothetical protein E8E12_010826 [Didymella heteroderae]